MAAIPSKQEIHAVHSRDGDVGSVGSRLSGNETGGQKPLGQDFGGPGKLQYCALCHAKGWKCGSILLARRDYRVEFTGPGKGRVRDNRFGKRVKVK